jgi:hypothetical protein
MMIKSLVKRRAENLRAMRSPVSLALGAIALLAVICATVFYDHTITDNTLVFSYFRAAPVSVVQ